MSSEQPPDHQIVLKLLVDKKRNRVIFAESDHEFVDTLFSFLTIPLGTVPHIIGSDFNSIGSISKVYESFASIEARYLTTSFVQSILLLPRNAAESHCSKFKLNINPTKNVKFYGCRRPGCFDERGPCVGMFKGMRCKCGYLMTSELDEISNSGSLVDGGGDGVFTQGGAARFVITDDLQVSPGSTGSCIALLGKLGISDGGQVEVKTVKIGQEEVQQLLKFSLLSKSPLTDVLLGDENSPVKDSVQYEHKKVTKTEKEDLAAKSNCMTMKLLVIKSKKRILYAEAGVDVVDFLLSFLTFPLGVVVKLLGKNSRLGCMDNLYKGAEELSCGNYMKSEQCKKMLLHPKLAPHFIFKNHPLLEEEYPQYMLDVYGRVKLMTDDYVELPESSEERGMLAVIRDPKSPTGEIGQGKGYLREPALFMIGDNLRVVPLSPITSLTLLNNIEVSFNDVEERVVTVGMEEALNLLKASLISKSPLNDVFNQGELFPEVMLKV